MSVGWASTRARFKTPAAIVMAAAAAAVQACDTGAAPIVAHDAGAPDVAVNLTGRWAMFEFEDPVAVDIRQTGDVLQGRGCCGGLGTPMQGDIDCCGDVTGKVVDRRASFGFSFTYVGDPYEYGTDVYVSANGTRMAGRFSRTGTRVAWLPVLGDASFLPYPDPELAEVMMDHAGEYALALADDPAPGNDFSAQQTYRFVSGGESVAGDLGSFWTTEIAWSAADQTLVVGPVPETVPGLPVALWLHYDGATLTSVEAGMASGVRYHFRAGIFQP